MSEKLQFIQLFQKTLAKEKQKPNKPRLQGNMEFLKLANNAGGEWNYPYNLAVLVYGMFAFLLTTFFEIAVYIYIYIYIYI